MQMEDFMAPPAPRQILSGQDLGGLKSGKSFRPTVLHQNQITAAIKKESGGNQG
jgi:hypothetical protein